MKHIINTLVNLGIDESTTEDAQRKIHIFNIISIWGLIINVLYIPLLFNINQYVPALLNVAYGIIFIAILFLNKQKKYFTSRVTFIIFTPLFLLGFTTLFGDISIDNLMFVALILSFFILEKGIALWLSTIWNSLIFLIVKIGLMHDWFMVIDGLVTIAYYFWWSNMCFSLLLFILSLNLFKVETRRYEVSLKRQKTEITLQNQKLKLQQEKLIVANDSLTSQKTAIQNTYAQLQETTETLNKSIQYASHIQSIALSERIQLQTFFNEVFVIFRPKDIVSGDFYWFHKWSPTNAIFVMSDCTGHGVAGAFMTMLGCALLNETVVEQQSKDASEILRFINQGVQTILKQSHSGNTDGMDMAICIFDKQDDFVNVCFAGAKASMYYFMDNELRKISGAKQFIGGRKKKELTVSNQCFTLQHGVNYYFYTDGFIDQNNAQKNRIGTRNFEALLYQAQTIKLENQGDFFEHQLDDFQKDEVQRDDITLVGLKI